MVGGQRFATVAALHDWLKGRAPNEKVAVLVRRSSSFDPASPPSTIASRSAQRRCNC